jgi:murein L,D-transpeptidase YcbB/YkuD
MAKSTWQRVGLGCVLGTLLVTGGCHRHRKTRSAPKSEDYADKLRPLVASKQMQVLHWPNFADYEPLVQTFYDDRNYEVAWIDQGRPTKQATAFIQAFRDSAQKGLLPEDYDASRWTDRVAKLASKNDDDIAQFDAAMTVCVMRYISDLRIGRVNPTHFNFDIDTQDKKYDLPEFVSDNAVDADDVPKLIASVEPDSSQYRKTEAALGQYLKLARQQAATPELAQPLPAVSTPISAGGRYPAAEALEARLQLEGDMAGAPVPAEPDTPPIHTSGPATDAQPATAPNTRTAAAKASLGRAFGKVRTAVRSRTQRGTGPASTSGQAKTPPPPPPHVPSTVYSADLAAGVKHYQARHGLTDDGKLTPATIASLNVPLSDRVKTLDDTLERWRWLPNEYVNAPLMVNLPEFVLRGYSEQEGDPHHLDFTMKVVVGKVVGEHQTPVFTHRMKYLIFRPFWNVPISIIKKELTPHLEKSGVGYLAAKNFETVNSQGEHVNATAAEVERGGVIVREKPGPKNSLGLVKFMFPNEYDIYLHSTPAPELFNRTRRDFSHGCIRVQHPDELAVWVLKNTPGDWDLQKVQDAMNSGQDNHTVSLKQPIPIVIFYATANVDADGQVHFFDDIYGYDKDLENVLSKGRPYPTQQEKVNPNAHGDTA